MSSRNLNPDLRIDGDSGPFGTKLDKFRVQALEFFLCTIISKMSKGTKRASPGAEQEKNPLSNVELSDEDAKKLTQIQRDLARAELILGKKERQFSQLCMIMTVSLRATGSGDATSCV
jgi:hypothetical protein